MLGVLDQEGLFGLVRMFKQLNAPRDCGLGIVSKRALVKTYGLSEAQATAFFAKPMTLTFAASGNASTVSFFAASYIVRLYGDQLAAP